ncbi:LexA repressor [Candidatus Methanobinarius endosymbioticus]|uniref:LexA repressor n=1 Tax=Candidatus Methanobinarius endosymbioticus TaxID=2006182 RepID=A0A366M944_9EURY|nr:LexA repressor [Candidatus Methanobinarius endosymbioticus]
MILLVLGSNALLATAFGNVAIINTELDGQNASVNVIGVPFGKDWNGLNNELNNYTATQMNNVDSNTSTLKEGLKKIAKKHGFDDVTITVSSQFGENQMPMEVVVDGVSMVPTLQNGEHVIIQKTKTSKVGDIIVVKDPEKTLLIKRLGNISGDQIFLSSDNNDTVHTVVNGVEVDMIAIEKWTNASNIIGVAKIFNV